MSSIYNLKPQFERLLRRPVDRLAASGIPPNLVTLASVFVSVWFGLVMIWWPVRWLLILLPFVIALRLALNAMDGMLAREYGQKTRMGAVLNELGDVVSDAGLYLPLAFMLGAPPMLILWIVVLGIIIEMTGVLAMAYGAPRSYTGPFGKADRAAAFGILAFLVGVGVPPDLWLDITLWILLAASLLTIGLRARNVLAAASAVPLLGPAADRTQTGAEPRREPPPSDPGPPVT